MGGRQFPRDVLRSIGRAVIDDDDLPAVIEISLEEIQQGLDAFAKYVSLIQDRNDHIYGEIGRQICRPRKARTNRRGRVAHGEQAVVAHLTYQSKFNKTL
ncbi:MAG TPA: hypothetical protein VEV85_26675 [Bryobacteraceae bacterium]|nr:hypothetical protein [Bryobacteraceae bacterium]